MPVIKDLVVDMNIFFDGLKRVRPYLISHSPEPEHEVIRSPGQRSRIDRLVDCISCGVCTTSCPVFWTNHSCLGPAVLVRAFRFLSDSGDEGYEEHMEFAARDNGALTCKEAYQCTVGCPKDINPQEAVDGIRSMMLRKSIWSKLHRRQTGEEREEAAMTA